jgi:hypothetical protein
MGYKTTAKKENPNRHAAFKRLRTIPGGGLEVVTMKSGANQVINPTKRFMLGKPYKHPELQKEVLRKVGQFALGNEKYAELEKQAQAVQSRGSAETSVEVK